MPTKVEHVQAAVRCGLETKIGLVPKSGGHSYAGLSNGSNDTITIDFQYMNEVSVDQENLIVTAGAGTLMAKLYKTLWQNGKLGAPVGLCATVAVGGYILGGGIDFFAALYGPVIDNLLEINMVDAKGNAVLVDPEHNVDLWWALRGIGPGYIGLVKSVKLRAFETQDLTITLVNIKFDIGSFKSVMENYLKWLDWTKENEPSITSDIVVRNDGIEAELVQLAHPRMKSTGNPAFLDILKSIFPNSVGFSVKRPTFTEFVLTNNLTYLRSDQRVPQNDLDRFDLLSTLIKDKAVGYYLYIKGFYVKKRFTAEDLEQVLKIVLEIPVGCSVWINSEFGPTRHVRPKHKSVWDVHRDALLYFKAGTSTLNADLVEPTIAWTNKLYDSMDFLNSGETYQSNPEKNLTDYLLRYYGSNLERLIEIKRKWDPKGYFNSEQSVPIS